MTRFQDLNDQDKKQIRRWVMSFIRPEAGHLLMVMLMAAIMTLFALAQPYFTKLLIDEGLIAGNLNRVITFAGLIVLMAVVVFVLGGINRWLYVALSGRILFRLREDVYAHLLRLAPDFFARWRRGDILNRLDGDVAEVQRFATDSLLAVVNGLLALLGSLLVMLYLSWKLTLVVFVLLPVQVWFLKRLRPRVERQTREVREKSSDIVSYLMESLMGVKLIQTMSVEEAERRRLHQLNSGYLDRLLKLQILNHVTSGVPGLLTTVATAAVFVAGAYLLIQGEATVGTLVAFSAYMARATGPVQTFLGLYVGWQRMMVSLKRVREVRAEPVKVRDPEAPEHLGETALGELRLEGVSFTHPGRDGQGVKDINLGIRRGEKVLITGPSGAGKTTLMDLLCRHYVPDQGAIYLDGVDLRRLKADEIRQLIGLVSQDVQLFRGTIADNIRFGRRDASLEQVKAAARLARLDTFIDELPDGYDTLVGEKGAMLSGGQQQRLALARTLLRQPRVVILDEATSAIDRDTEADLLRAIEGAMPGVTLIVISHRPLAAFCPDRTYIMERGGLREKRVAEDGHG
tara:strand:+ start:9373 stop:11091 length:1719 start_codon:yes stop_codon:yes gene_type:complete